MAPGAVESVLPVISEDSVKIHESSFSNETTKNSTTLHLVGTQNEETAKTILQSLYSKLPRSMETNLFWLDLNDLKEETASSAEKSYARAWQAFNPEKKTFASTQKVSLDSTDTHHVFVLHFSNESLTSPTKLLYELGHDLSRADDDTIIVPISDDLIDPKATACLKILVSHDSPLLDIKASRRDYRIPFKVDLLNNLPRGHLLKKGNGSTTLSKWNSPELSFVTILLAASVITLLYMYGVMVFLDAQTCESIKFGNPLTWPLFNGHFNSCPPTPWQNMLNSYATGRAAGDCPPLRSLRKKLNSDLGR